MQGAGIDLGITCVGIVTGENQDIGSQLGNRQTSSSASRGIGDAIGYGKITSAGVRGIKCDRRGGFESSCAGTIRATQIIEQGRDIACAEFIGSAHIEGENRPRGDPDI